MTSPRHKHRLPGLAAAALSLLAATSARAQENFPPTITTQPISLVVDAGQTAVFEVVATGTNPLYYQWLFHGAPITNRTNSVLVIPYATPTNAGAYSVIVSNMFDAVTSDPATLTVNVSAPSIVQQSTNTIIVEGRPSTFSVSVTAAPPPSYQWFFNSNSIPGGTNRLLTFLNTRLADSGTYFVIVSNTEGFIASEPVTLAVTPARTGPGSVDLTFQPGTGANNTITRLALQRDGRILAGGSFTSFNGANRNGCARLNPDGSLDVSFAPASFGSGQFQFMAEMPDGKILAARRASSLIRWNSDGSLDSTFRPGLFITPATDVLAVQPDDKIVRALSSTMGYTFERLNVNGSSDFTFNNLSDISGGGVIEFPNPPVFVATGLGSGKIYAGGPGLLRVHAHGASDLSFRATLTNGQVNALLARPDGKVFVAGTFTNVGGVVRRGLALLNTDGSLDTRFNPTNSYLGAIQAMALQPDGKLLIGGSAPLARLNVDGSPDMSFDPGTGASASISSILIAPDSKILVAGSFTKFDLYDRHGIVRLNNDLPTAPLILSPPCDQAATNGASLTLYAEAGCIPPPTFEWSFNGTPLLAATNSTLVLKNVTPDSAGEYKVTVTNPLGTTSVVANVSIVAAPTNPSSVAVDFAAGEGADSTVRALARQSNGKLMVAGWFNRIHGIPRPGIARLNSDGSIDETFDPGTGPNNRVYAIAVDSSDRILIGGAFTNFNGYASQGLARLLPNGEFDTTFDIGTGLRDSSDSARALVVQPDGKVVVGGWFSVFNNTFRAGIARLNTDGSVDQSFVPGASDTQIGCVAMQTDGKILAGGRSALFRFRTNGVTDFSPYSPGGTVRAILVQADGRILLGGGFPTINRLSPSGAFEGFHSAFLTLPFGNGIEALRLHACGKIVVAGSFAIPVNGFAVRYNILRISAGGALDPDFAPKVFDGSVYDVLVDNAKQIVIGGEFSKVDHAIRNGIARLHAEPAAPPPILAQPMSQTTNAGRDLLLSVTVPTCSDYTFQWQRNGADILGATNTTLVVPGVRIWETGEYRLVARNGSYATTSDPAVIQILPEQRNAGSTDVDFFPPRDVNGWVQALAFDTNRNLLVGGLFTRIAGTPANLVARFNSFGELDRTFRTDSNLVGTAYGLAAQGDGKTLAAGVFSVSPGITNFLLRLMPDGRREPNFPHLLSQGGTAYSVSCLPDGKILVGGVMAAQTPGIASRTGIARLHPNGDLDTNFAALGVRYPLSFAPQIDGRIIIGGTFTTVGVTPRSRIARLLPNGPADPTFDPGAGPNGTVMAVALARDEKVYIGGAFSQVNGYWRFGVARLNQDGSVDTSFDPGPGAGSVWTLAVQPDNKLLAGGSFRYAGGLPRPGLARFNDDGTIDTTFDPGSGANAQVLTVAFDPTGKIYAGGNFTDYNGFPRDGITRVNGDMFLLNPTLTANAFNVSLFTFYGQSYALEFTTSSGNPDWTPLSTVVGTGSITTFTDSSLNFSSRFYRVRTVPP